MGGFTKGPWHVEDGPDGSYVISDDGNGFSICLRAPWANRVAQSKANAALIAAAGTAATALEEAGYDAMACLERLPEIVGALKRIERSGEDGTRDSETPERWAYCRETARIHLSRITKEPTP